MRTPKHTFAVTLAFGLAAATTQCATANERQSAPQELQAPAPVRQAPPARTPTKKEMRAPPPAPSKRESPQSDPVNNIPPYLV